MQVCPLQTYHPKADFTIETILCPTDFSASSENAVRFADELASRMNRRLVLFHNITAPVAQELAAAGTGVTGTWRDLAREEEKKAQLEALKKALENSSWARPRPSGIFCP
jgi:nucleotide-binding universal stress UspA family protein